MLLDPSTLQHSKDIILAIIDNFSKWAKVIPLKGVKTSNLIKFIKHHVSIVLVYPDELPTTMDPNSSAKHFRGFVASSRSNVSSIVYYLAANGLAEAFNKTIEKLLKKFVSKSQCDCDDKLGECLQATTQL